MQAGPTDRLILAIDELSKLAAPESASGATWKLLVDELSRVLEQRRQGEFKSASQLELPVSVHVADGSLFWTQCLPGDYDNNGEVNISDLTAIAFYYGKAVDSSLPSRAPERRIDGDGNGEINLADIMVIGVHFGEALSGFQVISADDRQGSNPDDHEFIETSRYAGGPGALTTQYRFIPDESGYYAVSPRGVGQAEGLRSGYYQINLDSSGPNPGNEPGITPGPGTDPNPGSGSDPGSNPDPGTGPSPWTEPEPVAGEHSGLIVGLVIDVKDMPLADAIVEVEGLDPVVTNEDGYFILTDTPTGIPIPVKVTKSEYTDKLTSVTAAARRESFTRIRMLKRSPPLIVDLGNEGLDPQITGGGGFNGGQEEEPPKLKIKPGSLVYENGSIAEGIVLVYLTSVDVLDNIELDAAPGSFDARQLDGSYALLETFSMMEIYITTEDGTPLDLAEGESMDVEFPLDKAIRNKTPVEMEFYNFSLDEGKWVQEGYGEKTTNGAAYAALIFGVGWKNYDVPLRPNTDLALLSVELLDENGTSIPNAEVQITGLDYRSVTRKRTDSSGKAVFAVQINSDVEIMPITPEEGEMEPVIVRTLPDPLTPGSTIMQEITIDYSLNDLDKISLNLVWENEHSDLELQLLFPWANYSRPRCDRFNPETPQAMMETNTYGGPGFERINIWGLKRGVYDLVAHHGEISTGWWIEMSGARLLITSPLFDTVEYHIPIVNPVQGGIWHVCSLELNESTEVFSISSVNEIILKLPEMEE